MEGQLKLHVQCTLYSLFEYVWQSASYSEGLWRLLYDKNRVMMESIILKKHVLKIHNTLQYHKYIHTSYLPTENHEHPWCDFLTS